MFEFFIEDRSERGTDFRLIDEATFNALSDAKDVISNACFLEQKFDFCIENYIELEKTILDSTLELMAFMELDYPSMDLITAKIDRRCMNLLTTARAYVDAMPQHINKICGRGTGDREVADEYLRMEYDSRLGYRAMECLRNYVQHQGFPTSGAYFGCDGRADKDRYSIDPYISPVELQGTKFKPNVLKELVAHGEQISLKFIVRDYVQGLSTIQNKVRGLIHGKIDAARQLIEHAANDFSAYHEKEFRPKDLSVVAQVDGAEKTSFTLSLTYDETRMKLVRKNRHHRKLGKSYVTSEDVMPEM